MKEVIKKPWNYILYKDGTNLILSVTCGGVGIYEINIELNKREENQFEKQGAAFIDQLAAEIQNNSLAWQSRSIRLPSH